MYRTKFQRIRTVRMDLHCRVDCISYFLTSVSEPQTLALQRKGIGTETIGNDGMCCCSSICYLKLIALKNSRTYDYSTLYYAAERKSVFTRNVLSSLESRKQEIFLRGAAQQSLLKDKPSIDHDM